MENEIWKDVKGYEGLYKVSNLGHIKNSKGKLLKPTLRSNGYLVKNLNKDGVKTQYKMHRIVCGAFIENPENKPDVNHIDGNKQNNKLTNLEWCNRSENMIHAVQTGLLKGKKRPNVKLTNEQVAYIRKNYIPNDKEYGISALCKKFKINSRSTVFNILNGKTHKLPK